MKMAKPSAKDIAAAEELQQVLIALDQNQRWGRAALEDTPDFFQLIDDDEFDPEQGQHAQALYNKLVTLMWENPGFHNRVISGMCHVIMYEKNEIIDPESDCIDLHPRFAEMWNDLKRETQAARYWNKRYHQVVAERDEARAKLAAMESQKPVQWVCELSTNPWPNGGGTRRDTKEEALNYINSESNHCRYDTVSPMYRLPVPIDKPAGNIKDIEVTDAMASAFNQANCDDAMNAQDIEEIKIGLRAAISHLQPLPLNFYELEIKRLVAVNDSLLANERRLIDRLRSASSHSQQSAHVDPEIWHRLKTDPDVFDDVAAGRKTHEIRLNDRGFEVGHGLHLLKTVHSGEEMRAGAPLKYTGNEYNCVVTHVLSGYGLKDGWVILSIAPLSDRCPSHESEQHSFGESEFIPADLLLKPDLTDEDVESWRKQNLETKVGAVDEVITMLRRRPLPNDPFIKSGFSEAIAAVVTMRNSMNQDGVANNG